MPISHAMIVAEVKPEGRGVGMGVGQALGSSNLGSTVAPLVLVPSAAIYGWRSGFFLAALPGLVTAALIWWTIRDIAKDMGSEQGERPAVSYREAIANRNVLLCAPIAVLLVSYLVVAWSFLPLFLVNARGFSPGAMSGVMAVLLVDSSTITMRGMFFAGWFVSAPFRCSSPPCPSRAAIRGSPPRSRASWAGSAR